jgi:protein gp37
MKKLFGVLLIALFATTPLFAQMAKTKTKSGDMTHCYAMKDGKLMHCMGKTGEEQTSAVTLKNGTMISTTGEVTMKDGTTKMLENGQCITPGGKIMAFNKMHPMAKKSKMKTKEG